MNALASFDQEKNKYSFSYPHKALEKALSSESSRSRLNELLLTATPVFSSPLYIGKSINLKNRIAEHVRVLSKFSALASSNPDFLNKLRNKLNNPNSEEINPDITFGVRAIAAGFNLDHLRVFILDVEEASGLQGDKALAATEALEWLLNTWNRPILGRE
ncbi:hypothetical protein VPH49_17215 [Pseudomonas luteola]|uniref:hypothetical protein n=1 Tax=Pseudomonas luteola TaxID=47886 RepID=UPI003A8BF592